MATRARGPLSAGAVALILIVLFFTWPILLGGGLLAAGIAIPVAILALMGLAAWWLVAGEGPGGGAGDVARRSALGLVVLAGLRPAVRGRRLRRRRGRRHGCRGDRDRHGRPAGGGRVRRRPALAGAAGRGARPGRRRGRGGGPRPRATAWASATTARARPPSCATATSWEWASWWWTSARPTLPRGDTRLGMRVGMGEALLVVPRDVCVASAADVGAGDVSVFDRDERRRGPGLGGQPPWPGPAGAG